jgi:hypothetical protein
MSAGAEATMVEPKRDYLLELWDESVCPNCGKKIPEGTRVGSGRKSDGGFCSLGCYAEYHEAELIKRHAERITLAQRHSNS